MNLKLIKDNARQKLARAGICDVCKLCDGHVCAGRIPGIGGVATGASFKNNILSLAHYKLERNNFQINEHDKTGDTASIKCTIFGLVIFNISPRLGNDTDVSVFCS